MPTLYLVSTPIGNLEDITLRALRVLREVDLIAAEDTRVTRRLLARYEITTPLTPFHEHSRQGKLNDLLDRISTSDIALVSDAGTPTINDPGQDLVAAAVARGFDVVALPGASAVTAALAVSGVQTDGFVYLGFLPRRRPNRLRLLREVATESRALVAFEAPHRIVGSLNDLLEALGDRQLAVCRELTKLHEEVFRGSVSEAIAHFTAPRGEFTLVIEGTVSVANDTADLDATELLAASKLRGMTAKDAIAAVGDVTGTSRRDLYTRWLALDDLDAEAP